MSMFNSPQRKQSKSRTSVPTASIGLTRTTNPIIPQHIDELTPAVATTLQQQYGNQFVLQLARNLNSSDPPKAAIQRREEDEYDADMLETYGKLLDQINKEDKIIPENFGTAMSQVRRLVALKQEAESEGKVKIAKDITNMLTEIAQGLLSADSMPSGRAREMFKQEISAGIGVNLTSFDKMTVSTFAPEMTGGISGGTNAGGEFMGDEMQAAEQTERQRIEQDARTNPELKDAGLREKARNKRLKKQGIKSANRPFEVQVRIALLKQSLDEAFSNHLLKIKGEDGNILSVFVGPEWFFRRPDRPYTESEMFEVVSAVANMSTSYPNMMIVPGTVVWGEFGPTDTIKGGDKMVLRNTAPVVMNGSVVNLYHKRSDGFDLYGYERVANLQKGMKDEFAREDLQGAPEDEVDVRNPANNSSLFNVGNVSFALEICRDHAAARAKQEFFKTPEGKMGGEGAQVYLLPAHGEMPGANTPVMDGGYMIGADAAEHGVRGQSTFKQRGNVKGFGVEESEFMDSGRSTPVDANTRMNTGPDDSTAMYPGVYDLPENKFDNDISKLQATIASINPDAILANLNSDVGHQLPKETRAMMNQILAHIEHHGATTDTAVLDKLEELTRLVIAGTNSGRLARYVASRIEAVRNQMASMVV